MYNYRVTDSSGNNIGVLSLNSEDIPQRMIEGFEFKLECTYRVSLQGVKVEVIHIMPIPAKPKED